MARKISREAAAAFKAGVSFSKSNTEVITYDNGIVVMTLFGNPIATWEESGLRVSDAGYPTVTTKERLNVLLDVYDAGGIYQKDWVWYFDDGTPFDHREWQLVV